MNASICQFISRHWYAKELRSTVADQRLELPSYPLFADSIDAYLDPFKSLIVVPIEHEGNLQSSKEEAIWIAYAVKRLILDYSFPTDEIGIISPHRLQNNTILNTLKEIFPLCVRYPKIDTVERMQGQEFDLVFFSATVSDRNHLHSAFLKDYRRFNVSISRARKKFLFVASPLFFQSFPRTETELIAHFPFEDFFMKTSDFGH
jgi:superfamily I DNA and/or RNA helicase